MTRDRFLLAGDCGIVSMNL